MCALTLLTGQDILVSEVSNSIGNTLFENLFSVVNRVAQVVVSWLAANEDQKNL